ncbi:MAG: hypothetical protein Q8K58_06690 [Acidimicrobiales bacterium]|nr:hypothetical protein [Acidimicrobiales bacterium]
MPLPPPPPAPAPEAAWAPTPPPRVPPPGSGGRASPRDRGLGVAILGVFATGVLAVVTGAVDEPGVAHPDRWDPRIADLAEFVEDERELEFDHPVHVDFLTAAEYSAETVTEGDALDDADREELDLTIAQLRAVGLASGDVDLFQVINDVSDGGTLAFYTPEDERVRVRGTELTAGLRVTLVHELTHALQDQHFDLGGVLDGAADSSESVARRGLAEGDALRVEDAYVTEELSDEEAAAYEAEYEAEVAGAEATTSGVPDSIAAIFRIPYDLGGPFVNALFEDGGNDAVDDAFRDPPSTEEHLFDPASYLAGEDATDVGLSLGDVETLDEGPFGSPGWFLMLAERLEPSVAFDAVLGWAGDAYGVFERDGRTCVRTVFAGDAEPEETEMRNALKAFQDALPGELTEVLEVGGHPAIDACDPGPDADLAVVGRSTQVLVLPNLWGYLVGGSAPELGPDGSRCFAGSVLDGLTYEELIAPEAQEGLVAEVQGLAAAAYVECGSGER